MRLRFVVLCTLVLVSTLVFAAPSPAATHGRLTYVDASVLFVVRDPNALHVQYWDVGISWSVVPTHDTELSADYSYCPPFGHSRPCPNPHDTGARFSGVVPHNAFRIIKKVRTCETCDTFSNHRTVASARLDVTVPFTETTDEPNAATFPVHLQATWTDCRSIDGGWRTRVTGTLTKGNTSIAGLNSLAAYPFFDAADAAHIDGGTQPLVADLPICPPDT